MVWIKFVVCLAIILVAGTRLSRYGDVIAEKTGLGRIWIGVVLLATVTSLPELATGISSVALIGKPDLTLGDLFGSNLLNLVTIAIIDVFYTRGPVLNYAGTGLILVATASTLLIGAVATSIYIAQNVVSLGIFNYIGLYSPIIFCMFMIIQYMLIRFQRNQQSQTNTDSPTAAVHGKTSLKKAVAFFVIAALATAGAGTWLGFIGDELSMVTGLNDSFVGSLFLAICTSAPEIVVSISALRMGALDMAVGNVIGSNLFNMGVIIFVDDLFFTEGPLLSYASTDHIFTALIAMLMSSIVIIGLIYRPRFWPRIWVGIDATGLAILYTGAIAVLYFIGKF
ncbi:MAG: sodium:calcium antiporter [Chloroflexota bacterium]|nr:MAG: sodium:calcium antiporter [Chloroflexota bacterium]